MSDKNGKVFLWKGKRKIRKAFVNSRVSKPNKYFPV
jgi:hypothetical protein